jgi:hypothetical protein
VICDDCAMWWCYTRWYIYTIGWCYAGGIGCCWCVWYVYDATDTYDIYDVYNALVIISTKRGNIRGQGYSPAPGHAIWCYMIMLYDSSVAILSIV